MKLSTTINNHAHRGALQGAGRLLLRRSENLLDSTIDARLNRLEHLLRKTDPQSLLIVDRATPSGRNQKDLIGLAENHNIRRVRP